MAIGAVPVVVTTVQAGTQHGGIYGYAAIDADGPFTARVRHARGLRTAPLSPVPFDLVSATTAAADGSWDISLRGPGAFILAPEGKRAPLFVVVRPSAPPPPASPDVIRFEAGEHRPGVINLRSGQTLYLAPGAIVHGAVKALRAERITITGRGSLVGDSFERLKGPSDYMVELVECSQVRIDGITLRGSWRWTVVPAYCRNVAISRVAILNGRFMNDDGINPCNSSDVTLDHNVFRCDDDTIAIKGVNWMRPAGEVPDGYAPLREPPTERITITNSLFWSDRARVILIGHESNTPRFADIAIRDCRVAKCGGLPFLLAEPASGTPLSGLTIERVRIDGPVASPVISIQPLSFSQWNHRSATKAFGPIDRIVIRDVHVPGGGDIRLKGGTAQLPMRDVRIASVVLGSATVAAGSPQLRTQLVEGLTVVP